MEPNVPLPSSPQASPSRAENAEASADRQNDKLSPPRSVADIPGLGPIRVRALHKAGLGDLQILRGASVETLGAVPGMSEIKARHVLDYLAQFPIEALSQPIDLITPPLPVLDALTKNGKATAETLALSGLARSASDADAALPPSGSSLAGELMMAFHLASRLLTSSPAFGFRERLLRELVRFAFLVRVVANEANALPSKDQERLARRLARALGELTDSAARQALDRKEQGRLADALEEFSERLLVLRPDLNGRKAVPTHE